MGKLDEMKFNLSQGHYDSLMEQHKATTSMLDILSTDAAKKKGKEFMKGHGFVGLAFGPGGHTKELEAYRKLHANDEYVATKIDKERHEAAKNSAKGG